VTPLKRGNNEESSIGKAGLLDRLDRNRNDDDSTTKPGFMDQR